MSKVLCDICPHGCEIEENHMGFCRARANNYGIIIPINYGHITSMSLDPIEKKPLFQFYPGSKILSVGSFGCNLRCPFCQNYVISMAGKNEVDVIHKTPEQLIKQAIELIPNGNIGIAYTYNEPLIGYEFVRDCAKLVHKNNLKNVLVTNGYICEEPFKKLLPYIDALNIDLKAFRKEFYEEIKGDLETVKRNIAIAAKTAHVEIATLVIPGKNDSVEEIRDLSRWLASINPNIPLHLNRFFPCYKMKDRNATDIDTLYSLADIAKESLKKVYVGNC